MINQIDSNQVNTLVYELEDYISQYEIEIIEIGINETLKKVKKVNLILYIDVKGENFSAFIKEFQISMKYWNNINKTAYVSDKKHWKTLVAVDNFFTKRKEKYFDIDDISKAWMWIKEN